MNTADPLLKMLDAEPDPADAAPEYRLQEQVGFLLRKAHQRHVAIFAAQIGDLTPPQFAALAKLGEVGETSQSQLGALVAMDAATIKGVVDRLKGRGLVEVARDKGDRRRVMVTLTPGGQAALAALLRAARQVTAETLAPLSRREAEQLVKLLGRIS
ncbi:MAG: winged helix-turn-helix transcriptional regulator [Hyphomicrobiales bacterium]|nr:winged helix-turn-helix transcriptional regulator [Hyphomicrobiales bacterium]